MCDSPLCRLLSADSDRGGAETEPWRLLAPRQRPPSLNPARQRRKGPPCRRLLPPHPPRSRSRAQLARRVCPEVLAVTWFRNAWPIPFVTQRFIRGQARPPRPLRLRRRPPPLPSRQPPGQGRKANWRAGALRTALEVRFEDLEAKGVWGRLPGSVPCRQGGQGAALGEILHVSSPDPAGVQDLAHGQA